jgi:hypothetical protein
MGGMPEEDTTTRWCFPPQQQVMLLWKCETDIAQIAITTKFTIKDFKGD